ncbi:Putative Mg2+ and Co2+ transporter CorC [Streptobacillus moniliformis]|nr:Putative Mg2+ and Co2+ transporter CorC [Streptobacillus moniliformis]
MIVNDSDIKDTERAMIEKIIDFEDKVAREIMIPRTSMFAIDIDSSINEIFHTKIN